MKNPFDSIFAHFISQCPPHLKKMAELALSSVQEKCLVHIVRPMDRKKYRQYPDSIMLEVSALCHLSCAGCALHGPDAFVNRPFGNMKKELWKSIIAEAGSWGRPVSIITHGGGEPMMHPEFAQILGFAKSFPNLKVGFLTNGMLLNEAWADFLIDIGMDWIALSIDGIDPVTHDRIRRNASLSRVTRHLETLLDRKNGKRSRYPRIMLNMVAYDNIKNQAEAFVKKWIPRVDVIMISHHRNPPESKRWPDTPSRRRPCNLLWTQAVVAWDGRLGLCCEDFNLDHSWGWIEDGRDLAPLWQQSPKLCRVREIHRQGRYRAHPMCSTCDTWADSYVRKICFHEKQYRVIQVPSQTVLYESSEI